MRKRRLRGTPPVIKGLLNTECFLNSHLDKIGVPAAIRWFSLLVKPGATVLALIDESIYIFVHLLTNLSLASGRYI